MAQLEAAEANLKVKLEAAEASAAKVEASLKAQLEAAEARAEKAEARTDKLLSSVGSDLKVNDYENIASRTLLLAHEDVG